MRKPDIRCVRINVAEKIVDLARWVMPIDYMLEGERAAGMDVICGIGMRLEAAGVDPENTVTGNVLDDVIEFYRAAHTNGRET